METRMEDMKMKDGVGFIDIYYGILDFLVNKTSPETIAKKLGLTLKEFYILRDKFLEGAKEGIKNALKSKENIEQVVKEEEKRRFPRITLKKEELIASLNTKEDISVAGKVIELGIKNLSVRLKGNSTIPSNKIIKILLKKNGNFEKGLGQVIRMQKDKESNIVHIEVV